MLYNGVYTWSYVKHTSSAGTH